MGDFLFLTHNNHNPYFNLASEEYLLKQTNGFYIYLWINNPAVIVGINQNAVQEVNIAFAEKSNIKVVRRLTGGGAVYHDGGNICYTIIAPYNKSENAYQKFTLPIIEYLNSLGVKAEFSGRNDICIDGKKISGNAQTIYNDRIMHHGTILFDTDMSVLSSVLKPNKLKIESKGIKSVRARVVNVGEFLKGTTTNQFYLGLVEHFKKLYKQYEFTSEDISKIDKLVNEKYSQYDWNIGRSPKGKNSVEKKFPFGVLTINFDIKDGKIENAEIYGDFFSKKPIDELTSKLNGIRFQKNEFLVALNQVEDYIFNADANQIVDAIFN